MRRTRNVIVLTVISIIIIMASAQHGWADTTSTGEGASNNGIIGVVLAVIGVAAIAALIGTSYLLARKAERKMTKDYFVVKQMIAFPIVSFVLLGCGVFMFGALLIEIYNDYNFGTLDNQSLIALIPCSIVTGIGLFLVYISMRWRIVVSGSNAITTPFLGKTKTIELKDCKYILLTRSTPGFIAYDNNDKKVLSAFAYCRGYVPLVDAISPYVNNSWDIPRPFSVSIPKRENKTGESQKDIDEYLNEYTENEIDKTVSIKCENCGANSFFIKMNDVGNAIEIECKDCNEKWLILNDEKDWGDSRPNTVSCQNCKGNKFNVTLGFVIRNTDEVKWVYIGTMCESCGELDCPSDWKVDHILNPKKKETNEPDTYNLFEIDFDDIWDIDEKNNLLVALAGWINRKCNYGENIEILSNEEKVIFLVSQIEGEVNNGGFSQFFYNNSGNFANETAAALWEIGAEKTANICARALAPFGGTVPNNREERETMLGNTFTDKIDKVLNQCDKEFYEGADDLTELQLEFVLKNRNRFTR